MTFNPMGDYCFLMTPTPKNLRPFRFGIQASKAASRTEWIELAKTCENIGIFKENYTVKLLLLINWPILFVSV